MEELEAFELGAVELGENFVLALEVEDDDLGPGLLVLLERLERDILCGT